MPQGLSLTVGVLKRVHFSRLATPWTGWRGAELSPPPLAPCSLSSTSVQACSLLALPFPICYRRFWPAWILSALSRRPLVQEISPTCNVECSTSDVCSSRVRRRDQQGGIKKKKKKGVCGEGEHLACYLCPKSSKSLQESNTQLWLLTSRVPQAKLEGRTLLESLAAWEHQPRDPEISSIHSACLQLGQFILGWCNCAAKHTWTLTATPPNEEPSGYHCSQV